MKKIQVGFILGIVCFLIIGGNALATRGSGTLATEKRNVPQFHSIELRGIGNIYLQQGTEQSLTVTTDANLMPELNTEVLNGNLKIDFNKGVKHITRLDVEITMKDLKSLSISGSGNIKGKGLFKVTDLNIKISGSGEISLEIDARSITSNILGYGVIDLQGRVEKEDVLISGSGNYNAFDLLSQKATVVIKGWGNCRINAAQELDAKLYGSGNVEYRGMPVVTTKSFGTGGVKAAK